MRREYLLLRQYRFGRFHDVLHWSQMNTQRESLSVVVRELGIDNPSPRTGRIPKTRIEQFMNHGDIEVLGAVYAFITDERRSKVIEPSLQFEDYYQFVTRYYERCLREDPKSKWADSRYSAGHDLVGWFVSLWNDKEVPKSAIANLKAWLAQLYREGDEALRNCLVTATLEHLFEHQKIRKYFADWEGDPVLGAAFAGAKEWVQGGGSTPLGKPESFRKAKAAERKS